MKEGKWMAALALAALCAPMAAGAAEAAPSACELTGLQIAAGYVTFANTVKFLAAAAGALFAGVFLFHLRSLFMAIPLALWKAMGYVGVVALCSASAWASAGAAPYVQFVGAALGAGALMVLMGDLADAFGWAKKDATAWEASVAVLGACLALWQGNQMVAGVAVAGLMALLGFSAFSLPGMVGMGFSGKDTLWRATIGALAVLVPATLYRVAFGDMGRLEVFWPAIGWLCSLVACVGMLIASSRFFGGGVGLYMARNVGMLALGLFCIWAGSVHGMVEMQRVGGTFLVVWLFEKPWDIPAGGAVGYSFLGALSCGGLFMLMQEVGAHPERWGKFLIF